MQSVTEPTLEANFEINPKTLDNAALEFLRAYWQAKRAGRSMPARADLAPSDLRKYLDSIAMIDVLPNEEGFRYRLVGTALTQYFLKDPTGVLVAEAWPKEAGELALKVRENLRRVVAARAPVQVWGTLRWPDFPPEPFVALYIPFSDDGEHVTMIINMFTFDRKRVLPSRQGARQQGRTSLVDSRNAEANTG